MTRTSIGVGILLLISLQAILHCLAQHCEQEFQLLNGSCYYFSLFEGRKGTWQDGITECDRRRAELFTPSTPQLHALVSSKAVEVMKSNKRNQLDWWTSLNDKNKEGTFDVFTISQASSGSARASESAAEASKKYWNSRSLSLFFPWDEDAVSPYKAAPDRNCVALRTKLEGISTYIDLACDTAAGGTGAVICVKPTDASDYSTSSGDNILTSNDKNDINKVERECANDFKCIYLRKKIWTDGVVYYDFEYGFPQEQVRIIISSMRTIENNVGRAPHDPSKRCISFKNRNNRSDIADYVLVKSSSSPTDCMSSVGMYGGKQDMRLGSACFKFDNPKANFYGTIVHELMHILGFNHEHQRPDRDKYIAVKTENFQSDAAYIKAQFDKLPSLRDNQIYYDPTNDERYFEYDYESLLHYDLSAFGGGAGQYVQQTLVPLPENRFTTEQKKLIGQRSRFSEWDLKRMRAVYCDQKLPKLLTTDNASELCDVQEDKLCYKLFSEPVLTAPDAALYCESRGYQLVIATVKNYKLIDSLVEKRFGPGKATSQCDKKLTLLGNWYQGIRPQTAVFTVGSSCKSGTAFDLCGSEFFDCSYSDWARTAPFVCVKDDSGSLDSPYCARAINQDKDYRYFISCSNNIKLKPWPEVFPLCEPLSLAEYVRVSPFAFTSNASPLVNKPDQVAKFIARMNNNRGGGFLDYCTPGGTCTFEHADLKPYVICRRPNTRPFESKSQGNNFYKEVSGQFWLRGTVPYVTDGFDQTLLAQLGKLMQIISEVTCVDFVRIGSDDKKDQRPSDYVRFVSGAKKPSESSGQQSQESAPAIGGVVDGQQSSPRRRQQNPGGESKTECDSNAVGRLGGEQVAVLSPTCFDKPNLVLGVLLNILGIPADVVRPDRDDFIALFPEKITPNEQRRLAKQPRLGKTQQGFPFDFQSAAMFRYMEKLSDAPFVPQVEYKVNARGLSDFDKQKLRKIYPCFTGDCSPQYNDGNCYYYETKVLNKTYAYLNCRTRGMYLAVSTHDTFLAVDAHVDANQAQHEDINCKAKQTMVSNWDPLLLDAPNTTAYTEGGGKCADRRHTYYIVCQSFLCKKPSDWPIKLPSICARPLRRPSGESRFAAGLGVKRSILGVYCSYTFFEDDTYEYHVSCHQVINLIADLPPQCEPLPYPDLTDNLVQRASALVQYADFDEGLGPYHGNPLGAKSVPGRKIGFSSRTFNPNRPGEYLSKCLPNCRGNDVVKFIICRRPKSLK